MTNLVPQPESPSGLTPPSDSELLGFLCWAMPKGIQEELPQAFKTSGLDICVTHNHFGSGTGTTPRAIFESMYRNRAAEMIADKLHPT